MRKPKPKTKHGKFPVNERVTEKAYIALKKQGWAWKPDCCPACSGRLARQSWATCQHRGWGRLFFRCEDCQKYFDVLTFSHLITLRLPLVLVEKAVDMHFADSPPPSASQVGRYLGLSATPGGKGKRPVLLWDIGTAKSSLEGKPPPESLSKIYKCGAQNHVIPVKSHTRTMLLTDGAKCYIRFTKNLKILHSSVAHHKGEFVKKVARNRSTILCHTGTIDAAWSSCKKYVPKSLHAKHKDLLLYCKVWQWRYIHCCKNLAKETVRALQRG
eukprot:Skav229224  [mRNA]  locus=scaffold864:125682:127571:+ [translate_table: standard]